MRKHAPNSDIAERMMAETPGIFCLVKGAAEGRTRLNAFDNALINSGLGDTNLLRVSSILPPGAVEKDIDVLELPPGGLIPLAYASMQSTTPGRLISSAVAVGIPADPEQPGVIMEFEDHSRAENVDSIVRQMVVDAFEFRNRDLKEILSVSIEHKVERCGATFAAAVLWYEQ
ncbi:MAG: arginine decarboxylase, pyruvoyl-dependent [Balneolaceae bacterium]|nr:arginine decarboxylase, pyruvoyl-dependent [Balneolaceae bacterium]